MQDSEYIESCLRVYLQKVERDIGSSREAVEDFLEYLLQCDLTICRREENS